MFDPKSLGKQAALEYMEHNVPLNTSISKIASEHNLNPNQVTRVVEEANIITYKGLFEKNAEKTFSFDLANTKKILDKLASGTDKKSSETIKSAAKVFRNLDNFNYTMQKKAASKSLFDFIETEKVAEAIIDHAERNASERDVTYLKEALNHFEMEKNANAFKIEQLKDSISNDIKDALHDVPVKSLMDAIENHTGGDEKVASLIEDIVNGYSKDEVVCIKLAQEKLHFKTHPLDKGTIVNPDHPILKKVDAFRSEVKDFYKNEEKQRMLKEMGMKVRMNERMWSTLNDDGSTKAITKTQVGPDITTIEKTAMVGAVVKGLAGGALKGAGAGLKGARKLGILGTTNAIGSAMDVGTGFERGLNRVQAAKIAEKITAKSRIRKSLGE